MFPDESSFDVSHTAGRYDIIIRKYKKGSLDLKGH